MDDTGYIYGIAALMLALAIGKIAKRQWDPFEPIWIFFVGYAQVYIIQALSYREYALRVRGTELTAEANLRAFWSLAWFLAVYLWGPGRRFAGVLPSAPRSWSSGLAVAMTPLLILWGLNCARLGVHETTAENLLRQFPMVMMVGATLLFVTARANGGNNLALTLAGLGVSVMYSLIWMFNGKRSHALYGILVGVAAYYLARRTRPSLGIVAVTATLGAMAVTLAIGWRGNDRYERDVSGFVQYLGDFDPSAILIDLNLRDRKEVDDPFSSAQASKETEEYGGFLLMMDTVPEKSEYDYGYNYCRIVSTFIPRLVWPDKPLFGREKWVAAWIAGSEFPRDETFTGPAIGILGATQLNGGALGTLIVLAVLATGLRTAYEYFRKYANSPWAQAWWAVSYYNAWLMTVNDDPMIWFYYVYGFSILPIMAFLWMYNKVIHSPVAFDPDADLDALPSIHDL